MHPLTQSALEAVKVGDKTKAIGLIKQVLQTDPNDIDTWLLLATIVDEPQHKRQCFNRVLSLDPTHPFARNQLLQMDRAAMGANKASHSQRADPIHLQKTPVELLPPSQEPSRPQISQPPAPIKLKSRSFRMPLLTRLMLYVVTALAIFMTLAAAANGEWGLAFTFFIAFIVMCIFSWIFSFRVEVSDAGILVETGLSASKIGWNEIGQIQSGSFQHGLELKRKNGKSVKVSGALSGYPIIVEALRQKRPDLFGMTSSKNDPSAISFTETRVYQKSFLMRYSGILIGIPMLIFSGLAILNGYSEYFFVGIFLGGYSIYLISQPFFHVFKIKVEPRRLVLETFFGENEFTADQIENIWIKTVRGRYGSAFQYVMVKPVQGMVKSLRGFGIGEEVLYGVLMNWWSANTKHQASR